MGSGNDDPLVAQIYENKLDSSRRLRMYGSTGLPRHLRKGSSYDDDYDADYSNSYTLSKSYGGMFRPPLASRGYSQLALTY